MDFLLLLAGCYIVFCYAFLILILAMIPALQDKSYFVRWMSSVSVVLFLLVISPALSFIVSNKIFLFFTGVDVYGQW